MNDNLPEINFKEKKEKKGGALGWLRGRLGMGTRGAMGEAGLSPSAMNVGRALGTAKFGASSGGLMGLLAGKLGLIATIAAVAVASGLYVANNAPAPSTSTGAFSSDSGKNYVPAILRSQAANQGSSLDMFKDTNKGTGLSMDADAAKAAADKAAADKAAAAKAAEADATAQNPEQPAADQGNGAGDMMGKLQGGSMGSLTSSLGGGSSKFSGAGGFNNKFNQGSMGAKTGFSSGIGAGFSGMPKFDSRKGKMLAMKGSARPVFSGAKGGKGGTYGPKSLNQAKGLKAMQKTYSGTNVDSARSTQDKAWTGATAEGDVGAGGAGLGDGGAGVMTSPSLDNGGASGGGGGTGAAAEPLVPDANPPSDDSPWKGMPEKAMGLILMSCMLTVAGAALIKASNAATVAVGVAGGVMRIMGMILCGIAAVLAAAALVIGIQLMASHGQTMMGGIYVLGGGLAAAGAIMGMLGEPGTALTANAQMLLAAAALGSLFGGMMGGK
ncbi:MAG: hypothetical protein PHV36_05145 [Elusimicrobiales bacterium]|nr:hypothetical protein [Elusimicrobiales bacterium]